ncbi:MAG: hypothetical protein ABSG63_22180 [Spirochaetia bacterium]
MDMIICVSMPKGQKVMQRRHPVQDHAASFTRSRDTSSIGMTSPSQGATLPSSLKYFLNTLRMTSALPTGV